MPSPARPTRARCSQWIRWWTPPDAPSWGAGFARELAEQFTRTMLFGTHGTSLPLEANSVTIDSSLKDAWGLPSLRVTYKDHPDDLKCARFLSDRAMEIAHAAGARLRYRRR